MDDMNVAPSYCVISAFPLRGLFLESRNSQKQNKNKNHHGMLGLSSFIWQVRRCVTDDIWHPSKCKVCSFFFFFFLVLFCRNFSSGMRYQRNRSQGLKTLVQSYLGNIVCENLPCSHEIISSECNPLEFPYNVLFLTYQKMQSIASCPQWSHWSDSKCTENNH